jgi:hypothetical protein
MTFRSNRKTLFFRKRAKLLHTNAREAGSFEEARPTVTFQPSASTTSPAWTSFTTGAGVPVPSSVILIGFLRLRWEDAQVANDGAADEATRAVMKVLLLM